VKASDVIRELNSLSPNQYEDTLKGKWLEDLDGRIERELGGSIRAEGSTPAGGESAGGTALLVPEPWARDVYVNYLRSKIAEADAETERYNLYAAAFNGAYAEFAAWFSRTGRKTKQTGWKY